MRLGGLNRVPRPRRNDPLGVSDNPICVTDPEREAEVLEEFNRRLSYLAASYRFGKDHFPDYKNFNRSLARLKKAVGRPKIPGQSESRLDPRLEILINHRARKLAGVAATEMLGPDHDKFVQQAAAEIADSLQPIRGRPASPCLRHHVEGLMALIQETCGKPVLGLREKNSVYDPQLAGGVSQTIERLFLEIDPAVTRIQLVNIVRDARRAYAGKPMRFRDFFPLYGSTIDEQSMAPIPAPGYRLQHFELAAPIYCP